MRTVLAVLVFCGALLQAGEEAPAAPAAPATPATPAGHAAGGIRVLIVGGGSSHDFNAYFNRTDSATLAMKANSAVVYTDKIPAVTGLLERTDVLYLSHNQPTADAAVRKAVFAHAEAGKGVLLVHAALWYNWRDWPEYNQQLAGGGSRGHDKLGEFEVVVEKPDHPLMAGVNKSFKITDELYYFTPDPKGAGIEVLASAKSPLDGKTWPVVFVVKHPKTKIAAMTLGHDARAHDHPDYQQLLANAVKWVNTK